MDEDTVPSELLTCTPQGTWRVAGTRVSLDSVVASFWAGATPEEIHQDFPSLALAQVYSSIGYYLSHRQQVDQYLKLQNQSADALRQTLQERHGDALANLRQRILAIRESKITPA